MDISRLAQRQANSLPGFQLVSYYSCGIPFYKLLLNVTIQKEKKIGLIEEFCLKLIQAGIKGTEEISSFLGISSNLVEEAFLELSSNDLINIITAPKLNILLTSKGVECLETANIIVPEVITQHMYQDGLTGELYSLFRGLYTGKDVRNYQLHTVKADVGTPSLTNISFNEVAKQYKKQAGEINLGQLISLNEIERHYIEYRPVSVLIFQNEETSQWDIQIFDGAERLSEYESIIMRMENEGIKQIKSDLKQLPFEIDLNNKIVNIPEKIMENALKNVKESQKKHSHEVMLTKQLENEKYILENIDDLSIEDKYSKTCKIAELEEQIEALQKSKDVKEKMLNTYDHRPLLEDALDTAERYVVIISPWIKFSGFDYDLENKIKKALSRNVRVIIGYGIDKKTEHDKNSLSRLLRIKNGKMGSNLTLVDLSNTHEKVLLVDSKYVVITSFNWLSFKGDPSREFRQETGVYTESNQIINQTIISLEQRLGVKIEVEKT